MGVGGAAGEGKHSAYPASYQPCGGMCGLYPGDEGRPPREVGGGEGDIIGLVFLKDHPPTPQFKGTRSAVGKYQRLARRGSD